MTPEGVYQATIKDNGLVKARTGNFQIQLLINVTHDEENNELVDEKTQTIRPLKRSIFMPITPKTKGRVLSELEAIGYDIKDENGKLALKAKALVPGTDESFLFKGKAIWVECQHDEWQGKVREKWSICRRKMGGISREDESQFDTLFSNEDGESDAPF